MLTQKKNIMKLMKNNNNSIYFKQDVNEKAKDK